VESEQNRGLSLLKKGQTGLLHTLFSRFGLILLLLAIQVLLLIGLFFWFQEFIPHFFGGTFLFSAGMVLYLLNSDTDPTSRLTWLVVVMLLPVFGALLYWFTTSELGHRTLKSRLAALREETRDKLVQDPAAMEDFGAEYPGAAGLANYLWNRCGFPVYRDSAVTYFPLGEDKWQVLLEELEKAEKFIFLEYFIINEGVMWGRILEILARKAQEGVEVRVMYDGTCEFALLPRDYPKRLAALGIQCKVFARMAPIVSTHYNFRDHRKIVVIDGHTAFTGGTNLADEYINQMERFGHWKDTAVMVKGEAVRSFTLMFLQNWSIMERSPAFDPYLACSVPSPRPAAGFLIPYGDCPLDDDYVGKRVYMDLLNRAARYVHIMTPYLILDSELETALKFAAERGVEVQLILPGIPDKTIPYALAKTHYKALRKAGVEIYEYTPGFVHAKVWTVDDREGVVGTINLDYRSLYHHFECAAYFCGSPCVADVEQDFQETLAKCERVTEQTKQKLRYRILGPILKVVAPLL